MRRILSAFLFLMTIQLVALPAHAASPEKREVIVRLLDSMGAVDLGIQMAEGFLGGFSAQMRERNPEISEKEVGIVTDEIMTAFREAEPELLDIFVEIYDRHYTVSELREMEAFYATPLGQKTIRLLPAITQESIAAGQSWAQELMPSVMARIQQRLKREGVR